MKILLRGYYGFGNLGDDILMITSARLLRHIFPGCKIFVMSASSKADYILRLFKDDINEVLEYGKEPTVDLVVHGGGGTYYDFEKGSPLYRVLNTAIDTMGIKNWRRLYSTYRKLKGYQSMGKITRVGIGLGIGTFTKSSRKYYYKMSELCQFDTLFVRDVQSYSYIRNRGLNNQVYLSTDLAFMKEFWLPKTVVKVTKGDGIAFILKNCGQNDYLKTIAAVIPVLEKKGYRITTLFFERDHDLSICKYFKSGSSYLWEPTEIPLTHYLKIIASQSLVITSRAHGAILAGAFDIPAICVGIEPKLEAVRDMFPNSGSLLRLPIIGNELLEAIDNAMSISTEKVTKDFMINSETIRRDMESLKHRLIGDEVVE